MKDCLPVANTNDLVNGIQATIAAVTRPIFQSLRLLFGGHKSEVFTLFRRLRGQRLGVGAGRLMSCHRGRWAVFNFNSNGSDSPRRGPGDH